RAAAGLGTATGPGPVDTRSRVQPLTVPIKADTDVRSITTTPRGKLPVQRRSNKPPWFVSSKTALLSLAVLLALVQLGIRPVWLRWVRSRLWRIRRLRPRLSEEDTGGFGRGFGGGYGGFGRGFGGYGGFGRGFGGYGRGFYG
ncbi:hypothetical protein MRX96_050178, partial [Rhipicephalus microplus]